MPGMTGIAVVARALEIHPDLAVLMLTAVTDAPTATEALANGAMDYLNRSSSPIWHAPSSGRSISPTSNHSSATSSGSSAISLRERRSSGNPSTAAVGARKMADPP